MRILVIDNYDSFVYNLVQYLGQLGATAIVRRNDTIGVDEALSGQMAGEPIDGILISPGPGTPEEAGVCVDLVREAASRAEGTLAPTGGAGPERGRRIPPIFGVCLGHQAIGVAFGGVVGRAPELLHGKTSEVLHTNSGVLTGMPDPFTATRYHSLAVDAATVPPELEVTGRTHSGIIMAMRHRSLSIEGVQFHPESVLTQAGHLLLANWLQTCGDQQAACLAPDLVAETETRRLGAYALR